MIHRIITQLRWPRYVEVILGVVLIVVVMSRHSTATQPQGKSLLEYIIPHPVLLLPVTIILLLMAARLVAGPPMDYSGFFFKLLARLRSSSN